MSDRSGAIGPLLLRVGRCGVSIGKATRRVRSRQWGFPAPMVGGTARSSERVDRYQRDGLEEDPVSPLGSRLAEHRPTPLRLVRLPSGAIATGTIAPLSTTAFGNSSRRHLNSWLLFTSWRRATIDTDEPGSSVSATIRRFNASEYCRRFVEPACFLASTKPVRKAASAIARIRNGIAVPKALRRPRGAQCRPLCLGVRSHHGRARQTAITLCPNGRPFGPHTCPRAFTRRD
jgi:hypothetical protein